MSDVFIVSDNILSPLGVTTAVNFTQLTQNNSGIQLHTDTSLSDQPFYASLFDQAHVFTPITSDSTYTKFENLLIASISNALENSGIEATDAKTLLIISTTKGNVHLIEKNKLDPVLQKRIALPTSAQLVADYFGFVHQPVVVSNACISGVLGIITAKRLIQSGQYENVIIAGADCISKFVLSGFQAFQAVSPEPCKPFDSKRRGITLGEGAATIILSSRSDYRNGIKVMGGAVSNDASHISAPSQTGLELAHVIGTTLKESKCSIEDISLISAHGTATEYNDEMEAKAITSAGLKSVPTNSLKGYYGHTLGAAGLIESIISVQSLKVNLILPTRGFEQADMATPIHVSNSLLRTPLQNCLKIASGFGGCNAAIVFGKS